MITVKTFTCNPLQENCYVVADMDARDAVIIDCGAYYDEEHEAIRNYVVSNHLGVSHVLCTHGHFDHVFGLQDLFVHFGVRPFLHVADGVAYSHVDSQCRQLVGLSVHCELPEVETWLTDGQMIPVGRYRLRVLHTPGHTPGCVCFYCKEENLLFSGDTLFRLGVGRTDLDGGSWEQLIDSLQQKLAPLPAETVVYPGHGPLTRMADEVAMNPYFKREVL